MDAGIDRYDGHNNLARIVFPSSPVLRNGSTLISDSSISPTSSSAGFEPVVLSDFLSCVPPVIFSVFSGTESLGTKSGSTDERSSGGALSAPTLGISLAMVEFVFVRCGPNGLFFCISRWAGVVSCSRSLA